MSALTPFQTIGPFFHGALVSPGSSCSVDPGAGGARIRIHGQVWDGARAPVSDALLEVWQPDCAGFGRFATDAEGRFAIDTVLPGPTPGPEGSAQAPHLLVQIFARGLLSRLVTRIYFEGEAANEKDPILACVPRERCATLIARRSGGSEYRFDLVLQGADETVFFDV